MIVIVGATGTTAWRIQTQLGVRTRVVCLNDAWTITIPLRNPPTPRSVLTAMIQHSESLAGRTLSVGQIDGIG